MMSKLRTANYHQVYGEAKKNSRVGMVSDCLFYGINICKGGEESVSKLIALHRSSVLSVVTHPIYDNEDQSTVPSLEVLGNLAPVNVETKIQ